MEEWFVSTWKNGKFSNKNLEYGFLFGKKYKDKIIEKKWKSIVIIFPFYENEITEEITFPNGFSNKCTEIRSQNIKKWLVENNLNHWETQHPYIIKLTQIEDNVFRIEK